jgi:hypothetical protein
VKSRRTWPWLLAALLAAGNVRAAGPNLVVTTTSASRQFSTLSTNTMVSAALCTYAEGIKREWLLQLGLSDTWRDPILLVVRSREGDRTNAPVLRAETFPTGPHFRYQLNLVVPPAPDNTAFTVAIVELLCAEVANRDQPRAPAGLARTAPIPVWLSEGLAQSILGRPDQLLAVTRRSATGRRPQTAMEMMGIARLPHDTSDQALYRANAWLLASGFLQLPDGAHKMQQLLAELGATKTFARAFDKVYSHDFPDSATLENWWSNQLTRVRETVIAENYTLADTARRLDALLTVEIEARPPFDELWRFYDRPWLIQWLRDRLPALEALNGSGHPLYRPVVEEYVDAVRQLRDRKINRFRRSVHEAAQRRAEVDRQAQQIREILDRVESRSGGQTNQFEEFFQTLNRLEQFGKQRHDPIGDYLDQFDQ